MARLFVMSCYYEVSVSIFSLFCFCFGATTSSVLVLFLAGFGRPYGGLNLGDCLQGQHPIHCIITLALPLPIFI